MVEALPVTRIEIVRHRSEWALEFKVIAASLRRELGDIATRINQIGSTSVPGLEAKDVIDLQVSVRSLDVVDDARDRFEAAGFQLRHDPMTDHVPVGSPDGERLWSKWMARERDGGRPTNLHIRVVGCPNERYPLLFRDYLRANSAAAGSYGLIKRELARLHPDDIDAYYAIKDPVCDLIIDAAERWASSEGWQPPASEA
jgi:GrpB-like predicted nucleotidyltransferase (UPF0157 family)